jgi:arylsulfatase A-like enzyme
MYDIVTRVPLIVWAPGRFPGDRKLDGLCQMMDIGPAILELAGLEVPASMEAESLLPALTDDAQSAGAEPPSSGAPAHAEWQGRQYVFSEHGRDGILQEAEFVTMVRSREWKLVHFLDEPFGQLFDLGKDPGETENLWDNPGAADVKGELLDVLREWRIRSAYRTRGWVQEWR